VIGPPQRTLVLDENLNKRLSTELEHRGRNATRVTKLGLQGTEDPDLLRRLDEMLVGWILVTADDALPDDHPDAIVEMRGAISVVAPQPRNEPRSELDAWRCEVVQRSAHVMHDQAPGTVRRYSLRRHGVWRTRHRGGA
jgi:Domain of unknown function (DUF5615)